MSNSLKINELTAISPVDGRYRSKTAELAPYFSEFGLIKYRVHVEVEYFIALAVKGVGMLKSVDAAVFPALRAVVTNFSEEDALAIKQIEKTTNHDVKAVEYFLKEKMTALGLSDYLEYIHFGLTSQDINNTAIPLSLKEAIADVYIPMLNELVQKLDTLAADWSDISLLARTHGQPASPTSLGKEITVFSYRLKQQLGQLNEIPYAAKFGGATGNFNAHFVAFPEINWVDFSNDFVNKQLGLYRSQLTTQIEKL